MIISIHTRTLKSQLNNSCCPPMSCRGPMSHLDFLGRVRNKVQINKHNWGAPPCTFDWAVLLDWSVLLDEGHPSKPTSRMQSLSLSSQHGSHWNTHLGGFLGGFLKIGIPLNHPFIEGCFHCKPTILGSPTTMATRIYRGKYRRPTFRISSVRGILPRVASAMLRTRGKWEHHMETLQFRSLHAPWPHFWQDYITGFYLWRVYP